MPEAVNAALYAALNSLHWNNDARAKLLFLVLDAPPHDDAKNQMFALVKEASRKGIRIVPIVCSGAVLTFTQLSKHSQDYIWNKRKLNLKPNYFAVSSLNISSNFSHKPSLSFGDISIFQSTFESICFVCSK